jgi:hypothetical protein
MRLLDVSTHQLVACNDDQPPSYAVLSHTWGMPIEEVSFQEVQASTTKLSADPKPLTWTTKSGWLKIQHACAEALRLGYQYLWVDTCCIDKSSSAELQEGINSMFRWYEGAGVCLAYLSDVEPNCDLAAHGSAFRKAKWFSRGWTLQELLAPQMVMFFDRDWNYIDNKGSLSAVIEETSGIEARYIGVDHHNPQSFEGSAYERLREASVAQRMSWMSGRETTRREDMAYCLLGIFDIHMPMVYGEGDKAFARLQEEIMKASDDTTLLAWGYKYPWYGRIEAESILASSPASFVNCQDLVPCELPVFRRPSFSMTQKGLVFTMPVKHDQNHKHMIYAILACGPSQSMLAPSSCQYLLVIPLVSAGACESTALWKDQDEFLRYPWCTPMLVSTKFLEGAETRSLVIRRPSRLTERLRYLPFIVRPPRGCNLVGQYPPQPVDIFLGTRFISLSPFSFLQPRIEPHQSHSLETDPAPVKNSNRVWWSEDMGVRVFLVGTSAGNLLLTLEYELENRDEGKQPSYVVICRAFEAPTTELHLELFHGISFTKKYGQLPEVPAIIRNQDMIFRIKEEDDVVWVVRIRKSVDPHVRTMTEIEILTETEY